MSSDPNISLQRLKGGEMDRDPNNLSKHVTIEFDEILGEPVNPRAADCVWQTSERCFRSMADCTYKALTFVCAIPIAACWGCYFACTAFNHIWYMNPALMICRLHCHYVHELMSACFNAFLAPVCEVCALCFSKIKVDQ